MWLRTESSVIALSVFATDDGRSGAEVEGPDATAVWEDVFAVTQPATARSTRGRTALIVSTAAIVHN
jgi:hypothetical protein